MKDGTENKIKFKTLGKALGLSEWEVGGLLNALWRFTKANCPRGDVGKFTNEQIALGIDWQRGSADDVISALVAHSWLDAVDGGDRLIVHDWPDHCEDSVHNGLARKHAYFANGDQPKTSRLHKDERAAIEEWYRTHEQARAKRVPARAGRVRPHVPSLSLSPALAKPSQAPGARASAHGGDELPEPLRADEFAAAWERWLAYRTERKLKTTAATKASQLEFLARAGPAGAIEIIDQSIRNGWQGLFEPKDDRNGSRAKPTTGKQYDPGAKGDI